MFRRFHIMLLVVAIIASLRMFNSIALAEKGSGSGDDGGSSSSGSGGSGLLKAKGSIAGIDLTTGTLIVSDKKHGLVTIAVDSSTEIRKDDNKNASLNELRIGDRVDARYDGSSMIAQKIKAKGGKVEGILTNVDLAGSTLTITPFGGEPVTLFVTANTKVERNEQHVTLSQLKIGDLAEALFDGSTYIATKVETVGQ